MTNFLKLDDTFLVNPELIVAVKRKGERWVALVVSPNDRGFLAELEMSADQAQKLADLVGAGS